MPPRAGQRSAAHVLGCTKRPRGQVSETRARRRGRSHPGWVEKAVQQCAFAGASRAHKEDKRVAAAVCTAQRMHVSCRQQGGLPCLTHAPAGAVRRGAAAVCK
eukprot:364871-Chlamydomonas_euryale.AAC.8